MAQRQLLRAAVAFAATAGALASSPTLTQRIAGEACWGAELSGAETYPPLGFQAHSESDVADLFEIVYVDTFKAVISKMAKERYMLTQCGLAQPTSTEVDGVAVLEEGYTRKHFGVPIQTSMSMTSVTLGFLDAHVVQDRVSYVSQHASAPCWQKALSCSAQLEDIWAENFNAPHLAWQQGSVDVVFMDCSSSDCSRVNGLSNRVHVPTTQDPRMLATAE